MQKQFIRKGQAAIYRHDHKSLKELYMESQSKDYQINISDIFLKLFYYACTHGRRNTIIFLFQMYYEIFSQAEQIALRQSFYYGKFKIKDKNLQRWYTNNIIPIIRLS